MYPEVGGCLHVPSVEFPASVTFAIGYMRKQLKFSHAVSWINSVHVKVYTDH